MYKVEVFEQALDLAAKLGYEIRQDCLAGQGGGCELRGKKLFFVDLDLGPDEQLEQVINTLVHESNVGNLPMSQKLRELLEMRGLA